MKKPVIAGLALLPLPDMKIKCHCRVFILSVIAVLDMAISRIAVDSRPSSLRKHRSVKCGNDNLVGIEAAFRQLPL